MTARLGLALGNLLTRPVARVGFIVMAVLHPIVHGTPLDGGTWDAMMAWLTTTVMTGDGDAPAER